MSVQSVDDHEPSSSTPVFGSAVSQTKLQQQQQPVNDLGESEKLVTPPQPAANAVSDQSTTENGNSVVEQVSTTSDSQQKPTSNEPEPELISPAPDNAPSVDAPAETQVPTSTSANDSVPASATAPEATVIADSSKSARQTKSPRGKAKAPVAAVAAPTRQSNRARKPVAVNADEEEEEAAATTATPKHGQRQPKATTTTTTEESVAQPAKNANNAGKKRAASPPSASKKAKTALKGKQSEDTSSEKPPAKKARASATKKPTTPEATGDYVRKLRPRK